MATARIKPLAATSFPQLMPGCGSATGSRAVPSFHFGVKIPVSSAGGVQYQEESISTPLTIVGDQKQVLGKITLSPAYGDVLFVVLSRK